MKPGSRYVQAAADRLRTLLAFADLTKEYDGVNPTIEELRVRTGASTKSLVANRLHRLEADGLIAVAPGLRGAARARRLTKAGSRVCAQERRNQ